MPDYRTPREHRLTDVERARLADLAGLIPADHPQMWRDAELLCAACVLTGRPAPNCARPGVLTDADFAAIALNARALLQVTS